MAVIAMGGSGKYAIIAAAIYHCHSQGQCCWHRWLNPTATTINNIVAVEDCHHRCHTVGNNDCQKPVVILCP
jgi:hypothetical protein